MELESNETQVIDQKRMNDAHTYITQIQPNQLTYSIFDSLSAIIAVLDEEGTILAVNRAWNMFNAMNQPKDTNKKKTNKTENYLFVCDTANGINSEEAQAMAEGIRAVISGRRSEFTLDYPCHSPLESRWFKAHVTRFPVDGILRIIVAHENITSQVIEKQSL